ncbi:MAG: extracellular solute-binding protein [Firmicutes bacterium]|nr:extracellular solute-binding protein [Bacillota bacterium]
MRAPLRAAVAWGMAMALSGLALATAVSAQGQEKLVFDSAQGYDQAEATAFQQRTGIRVELSDMSTGPLLAKVTAERENPQWDVVWFDGNAAMAELDAQHMLLRGYTPPNAARYTALGRSLLPADHAFFPTGVTAAGVIVYNTRLVPPADAPRTWTDLLRPFFRNAVGMNNPAVSGPTYPIVAGILAQMGMAKGERFFLNLKRNGLVVNTTNGITLQALLDGKIKAAIVQDSAAQAIRQSGGPVKVVYPPSGVVLLPSDIAIDAKAPDMAAAKEFVNFVLSPYGQRVMQDEKQAGSDSLFQPIIQGVRPLVDRAGVTWIHLDPYVWGARESSIVTWFTDHVVR